MSEPMEALARVIGEHSADMSDERLIDGQWVYGACCECGEFVPLDNSLGFVAHVAGAIPAAGYLSPEQAAARERQAGAAVLREAPCRQEAALLRAFWDLFWNGPGSADYGDHSGYTHAEMVALDDAAALVEDHFVEHGCRLPPRDRAERLEAGDE